MLEGSGALRTWALSQPPETAGVCQASSIDAEALAEHRLAYLAIEGPISGGRGGVARCDQGEYQALEWSAEKIVVRLSGERLSGTATLLQEPGDAQRWRFWFLPDASGSTVGGAGESWG